MVGFFEKFRAFILAVAVHIAMGALLIVGFDHSTPTPKPMAREQVEIIKGSVVDETALQEHVDKIKKKEEDKHQAERDRQKALEDAAKKAQDEKRKAEEAKKKAQDETKKLAEQKVADEKRLAELAVKRKAEEEAKRKAEDAKKKAEIETKKLAEKKVIEEKRLAEIEVKRKAEEVAKQKAEAERKQAEEEKRKVDEARKKAEAEAARKKAAAEAKRKAEEKARKAREAEEQKLLDQLLESEGIGLESENQSQLQILKQRYISDIAQKVESSWLRTSNFQEGWKCKVLVKQGPGGVVLSAAATDECDGDEQFRTSVENAVYRAEPLPPPEDSSLFTRELELTFRPEN
ncbi:MAG: cell envelope integrity protein TolA [Gammaproteobacteria bacterium]|nr:cell envelope integrity protein TolA [Gammaproteobacteria bacterium]